jgi:hypothetical protein
VAYEFQARVEKHALPSMSQEMTLRKDGRSHGMLLTPGHEAHARQGRYSNSAFHDERAVSRGDENPSLFDRVSKERCPD